MPAINVNLYAEIDYILPGHVLVSTITISKTLADDDTIAYTIKEVSYNGKDCASEYKRQMLVWNSKDRKDDKPVIKKEECVNQTTFTLRKTKAVKAFLYERLYALSDYRNDPHNKNSFGITLYNGGIVITHIESVSRIIAGELKIMMDNYVTMLNDLAGF